MKYENVTGFNHGGKNKIGVLLVNLGTPKSPTAGDLRTYLREFLSDPRVVEVPRLIWFFVLNLIILVFRPRRSAEAYASIWQEQGSPLLINSQKITDKVREALPKDDFVVELAMRYGQPSVENTIAKMEQQGISKLLVLPLYPQYSATTTASTFDAVVKVLTKKRRIPEFRFINQYCDNPLYVKALAQSVEEHWEQHGRAQKLMLSYHGIPKAYWDNGDAYICQCHKTTRLVAEQLGLADDEIMTVFQSRFGRQEWVRPYTDETLKSLPEQGVKSIQIMCPAFSADCLETLEEIEEENKEYFMEAGGESYQYIPCLNDNDMHITALTNVIEQHIQGWQADVDASRQSRFEELKQKLAAKK